jgi:metaxin
MLGDDLWLFGAEEPGVIDAALFAYTHLILTLKWDKREANLARAVRRWDNLVSHENRIRQMCFPNAPAPNL